jgi:predicted amidohydrolase
VGPEGTVILRYRKLNDTQCYLPTSTNPGDIYSAYVERYGLEGLFPVVDTPIGRLACLTCYDVNFPEVARCLALRGAEILCMPTGEGYTFQAKHRLMKRARAYENTCYLVTANHGEFIGRRPRHQQRGYSEIIDFTGETVALADGPGECTVSGRIDLRALREARHRVDFFNFLVGLRASLYAPIYANAPTWPLDGWLDHPLQSNEEAVAMGEAIRDRLYAQGIFVPPPGTGRR